MYQQPIDQGFIRYKSQPNVTDHSENNSLFITCQSDSYNAIDYVQIKDFVVVHSSIPFQ